MSVIQESFWHAHRACPSVFVIDGTGTLGIENRKRSVAIDERMKALGLLRDDAGPDESANSQLNQHQNLRVRCQGTQQSTSKTDYRIVVTGDE